jgi:SOS-response transcriptional repressor LexA
MPNVLTPAENLIAFIVARRTELGLTQREVAAAAGMEPGTLANLEVGRVTRSPRADTLSKLARGLRVSPDVLSRLASGDAPPVPAPRVPFDAAAFDQLRELTAEGHAIAYYGRVGCGEFVQMCEVAQGVRNVPARFVDDPDDPMLGTVEAWGDSMTRAKIHEGMTLLVRCQNTAKPGQVVLADVPFAGTTCKRLVKDGRKLYLVAESSGSYPRIEVTPEVRIVGVVTAAWLAVEF